MSGGGLKITRIKQTFAGKIEQTFLGELSLLDVNEGSMNIYIGYEIKKGLFLQILVTSETIMLKMVKHLPIKYEKIDNSRYLFLKNEEAPSKVIIGSHIGINNYNQDSVQKVLFNINCNPFGGMKTKLGEKYLIEINNNNNEVSMVLNSSGIEMSFLKDPEISINEVFDIFKEELFTFSMVNNMVSKRQIQHYNPVEYERPEVKNWNEPDEQINYSQNEKGSDSSDFSPFSISKFILFVFFLFCLFRLSIALFSN